MARRYGMSFWVGMAVVLATFVAAPAESARFSLDLFAGVGQVGEEIVSELVEADSGEVQ